MVSININTQQLRYFMELSKCLNFTRAAANLYVAQPTLSQQIAELETQLGVTLFTRSSRSVTLTPAGKILQNACPLIMSQLEGVQQHMLLTAAGFSGSLNVGFLDIFSETLPQIMRDFNQVFPDVVIKPINANQNELNNGLKNCAIDVALSLIQDFAPEEQAPYSSKLLLREAMCLVVPGETPVTPDYAFAASSALVTFAVSTASCYYPHISACLKKHGIQVPQVIFTNNLTAIRCYLESGTGFSVLPESMARFFPASTQFIPLPDEYLKFGAVWDPNFLNPSLPLFLDTLDPYLYPDSEEKAAP